MKKIVFLILFLTGFFPVLNDNGLYLESGKVYGQEDANGLETVYICNAADKVTTEEYTDYYLVETCTYENEDDVATNKCVWNCNTVFKEKPDPDPDPDDDPDPDGNPDGDGSGTGSGTGSGSGSGSGSGDVVNVGSGSTCTTSCGNGYVQNPDTCGCLQLPPCPENAHVGISSIGKVIAIFYHGGFEGGGEITTVSESGGTGRHFTELSNTTAINGKSFLGEIIAPGATAASGVALGKTIISDAYNPGDQVVIYGYSWGGDLAVDLATELKDLNIPVNLLITVDASDGPLQNTTVNTSIPDNVLINLNVYQTTDSGSSSGSDGGTSNFPGSNGGPNTAIDSSKTEVINKNVTSTSITHGTIQDDNVPKEIIDNQINNHIQGCN